MADNAKRAAQAKPVSLHPLSLEDALRGVIATGPMDRPADTVREIAADQVKPAGRKSSEASRGRKRPLKGEPGPEG